jgi:hypothetical protein
MATSNSQYKLMLEKLASEGKKVFFTDEQNLRIVEELNEGMEEFLYEQRIREKESEIELAGIILNA